MLFQTFSQASKSLPKPTSRGGCVFICAGRSVLTSDFIEISRNYNLNTQAS